MKTKALLSLACAITLCAGFCFIPTVRAEPAITCNFEQANPDWVFSYADLWAHPEFQDRYSQPAYPPPIANQTAPGVYNLTFTAPTGAEYYPLLTNRTRYLYPFPNGSFFYYDVPYSGPTPGLYYPYNYSFSVVLNTTFWGHSWVLIEMRTTGPQEAGSGAGTWEKWVYCGYNLSVPESLTDPSPQVSFHSLVQGVIEQCVRYFQLLLSYCYAAFR